MVAASLACSLAAGAQPKQVMLLHSFGPHFRPWSEYARTIRAELRRQSPFPLDIIEYSLVSGRSADDSSEAAFVEYLRALHAKDPLDLIVSIGAPAAGFVQRYRHQLFAKTPMVFTAVDHRRVQYSTLTENDAVVAVGIDYLAAFENILQVLPDTKTVAVVVGTSPVEKFWADVIARTVKPLDNRISLIWYNDLSFEEILQHAAALPRHSAIFWELMLVDAAGVVHEGNTPLTRLHAVANAPIFSYDDAFYGRELVGRPMHSAVDGSLQTVAVAVRILRGEKAGDIKMPPLGFSTPKYDWREMQRWGISESRLPPGSVIQFRDPTTWQQYRLPLLAICAALLLQAALITWLIYEHRRRHAAEVLASSSMSELAHMNRVATAGELSASIAHEVNQPLTGISARASAALRWLAAEKPDIEKTRAALTHIVNASHHASEIVTSVRAMFRKDSGERHPVDINQLILTVLDLVRIELRKHNVEVQMQLDMDLPRVECDRVQVQQVILNLVINAAEAMHESPSRVLRIRTSLSKPYVANISIEDTGSGIDPENLDRIFRALFTTKSSGMGMGLSICHSIIESHKGRIWASAAAEKGSVFQFELPTTVVEH